MVGEFELDGLLERDACAIGRLTAGIAGKIIRISGD